ncbi:AAA family ATPase [Herbaspirillum rubrisubalbicans]|uniref:Chromosome segregation protein SMC n=1 Tax=Herbaspirillum rubrisubalbicans TaxID=80842 RepID=A0ABX9BUL1_9BURK|nr:ATP-binding protein [Herbaspirillum rubrisubalbicans]RAM61398.1 chromosome segregation protein SMC [Herbaspirillum rubrisubalbicans]
MLITKIDIKNWRNFKNLRVPLNKRTYIIGANASGKSNLLDVFRFLRDISKPAGGGLQKAVADRGGMGKLRCLEARTDPEIKISVEITGENEDLWKYELGFAKKGAQVLVTKESATLNGDTVFSRPDTLDEEDIARRTQTHLEQIGANKDFRPLADFFSDTTYLHLVPQLLKFPEIAGTGVEGDPFGQALLQRISKTPGKTRDARLNRIQQTLAVAVPQFKELKFVQDSVTGNPHLEASYQHWRKNGAWQREDQFSDGTLRLIGMLWMLQESSNSLLLLEEPELSLNDSIVSNIPLMIDRILRKQKAIGRQVIITTHSEALLKAPLASESIILLESSQNGALARLPNEGERNLLDAGLSAAEVLLPKTHPNDIQQLGLFK